MLPPTALRDWRGSLGSPPARLEWLKRNGCHRPTGNSSDALSRDGVEKQTEPFHLLKRLGRPGECGLPLHAMRVAQCLQPVRQLFPLCREPKSLRSIGRLRSLALTFFSSSRSGSVNERRTSRSRSSNPRSAAKVWRRWTLPSPPCPSAAPPCVAAPRNLPLPPSSLPKRSGEPWRLGRSEFRPAAVPTDPDQTDSSRAVRRSQPKS